MESAVLARVKWITDQRGVFWEQQSGFRWHCCTAYSLGDVVSVLKQAHHDKEVVFLFLLDMRSPSTESPIGPSKRL